MPKANHPLPPEAPFKQRLRYYRDRSGRTRAVVGGLCGRSADWVKSLESGTIEMPPLPMLARLAEAVEVDDLFELTGEMRLSRATYTKHTHSDLERIRESLASYPLPTSTDRPVPADILAGRVQQAWRGWHTSRYERDAIADHLPGLIADARVSARLLEGNDRREAARQLAQAYHIAQLYASHQPAPELVYMTGDRAMHAAQDADDPAAMAGAAWYLNHMWRDAGEAAETRVEVALNVAKMLRPDESATDRALYSLMQLAVALSHAKLGRDGDAWHHHDQAWKAAKSLGSTYAHPWLMIGPGMVSHYAVTIYLDLQKPGLALNAANKIDPAAIPSRTRQSRYLVEVARAHHREGDEVAAVGLMTKADKASADTFAFSLFARSIVSELLVEPPASVADDVRELARKLHLTA